MEDKSVLVVYKDKEANAFDYFTISITGKNYYHLTGLAYKNDSGIKNKDNNGSAFESAFFIAEKGCARDKVRAQNACNML